jgi:adenosylcobyric acid synthase
MWRDHGLPEEDGVFDAEPVGDGFNVAVIAYPRISNLDEFAPLKRVPGLSLSWARRAASIARADLLILPGSKHVAEDLAWLRASGLDRAILRHVEAGKPTLAVCGGLQILGTELRDPEGVEGAAEGLGVLPLLTEYRAGKHQHRSRYRLDRLGGYWEPLSGVEFDAYEIRHGRTEVTGAIERLGSLRLALPGDGGWQQDSVLALYTHGLFENAAVIKALFGAETPTLEDTLDGLADFVDEHLGRDRLMALLEERP